MKNNKMINIVPVVELESDKQLQIRKIRNKSEIRRWMFTDHVISKKEHIAWIHSLKNHSSRIVFAILKKDQIIGVFNIYNINEVDKSCEWGWFIDPIRAGSGLGSAIEFNLINFIFEELNMIKQTVAALEENAKAINLYKKFFFKEERFKPSHIVRDGKRTGSYVFSLSKSDWNIEKEAIKNKYKNFQIVINWKKVN